MIWSLLAFPAHAFSSIAPSYSSGLIQLSSWPSLTIHSKVNFPSLLFSYYLTLHCFHFSITLTTYYVFLYIHLFITLVYLLPIIYSLEHTFCKCRNIISSCSLLCTLLAQAQCHYSFSFSPPIFLWLLKINMVQTKQPVVSSLGLSIDLTNYY